MGIWLVDVWGEYNKFFFLRCVIVLCIVVEYIVMFFCLVICDEVIGNFLLL